MVPNKRLSGFSGEWRLTKLEETLDYLQPTNFIVRNTDYSDDYETPVLTAGKSFVLGYTSEVDGIFSEGLPVIIFDDFTTDFRLVRFKFKVKSSALKILKSKSGFDVTYIFNAMKIIDFEIGGHQRHWISIYSKIKLPIPPLDEQRAIADVLSSADDEIETIQQRIDNLKTQKKGLMQQLLTATKRIKPQKVVSA